MIVRIAQWLLLATLVLHGTGAARSLHFHTAHGPAPDGPSVCGHHDHGHAHQHSTPEEHDHHHDHEDEDCELCLLLLTSAAILPTPAIADMAPMPSEIITVARLQTPARDREHSGTPRAPPIV